MKNWIIAIALLGSISLSAKAGGGPEYSALTISKSLSKGANAVIRQEEVIFTVHSPKSATEKVRQVITVLNADGKEHADLVVSYDKLKKVDYIKGTIYDMMGKKVRNLKNSDIRDYSANGEGTLFGDNRMKVVEPTHSTYPYTVEYEYQTSSSNMLFYTTWVPVSSRKVALENASFQVQMPKDMNLRYHEQELPQKVTINETDKLKTYAWQLRDIPAIETEQYGPPFYEIVPLVRTAPSTFEVEGYAGNMESWKALGEWQSKLNEGRNQLPEATKQQVLALTKGLATPEEKIKAVYQFMQNKTRYVSIQLGIGGWQPFEASFVDSKGYGDCKALSNYTKALLEAAGIQSHYALIYSGSDNNPVSKDFPVMGYFNHAVLCVPTAKDTIWLECTSQMADAGYTGSSTGDRYSLLVTPEGGKLVSTPRFTAQDNTQKRMVKVKLNAQGGGTGEVFTQFTGRQHESRNGAINHATPEEQRKWLYSAIDIPAFEIKNFSFEKVKDVPQVNEKLQLELPRVASVSGRRMFITPNLMNRQQGVPLTTENRKYDVVLNYPYVDVDTVEYEIPVGYKAESVPQPVKISSVFGQYEAKIDIKEGKLVYLRQLTMHKGRFAPTKYAELVDFMKQVSRADQQQVVLATDTM